MRNQYRAVESDWTAPNPPYGAILTYHLRDAAPAGTQWAINITDATGRDVRRIDLTGEAGVKRVVWNLAGAPPAPPAPPAGAPAAPARGGGGGGRAGGRGGAGGGTPVTEGRYVATIGKVTNGTFTAVGAPQSFSVVPLPAGK